MDAAFKGCTTFTKSMVATDAGENWNDGVIAWNVLIDWFDGGLGGITLTPPCDEDCDCECGTCSVCGLTCYCGQVCQSCFNSCDCEVDSGGNGTVTVTPDFIPASGQSSMWFIIAGCDTGYCTWKLTSTAPEWLRLSLDASDNFSTAKTSITGTGWEAVYVFVAANETTNSRTAGIYAGDSPTDIVTTVVQEVE